MSNYLIILLFFNSFLPFALHVKFFLYGTNKLNKAELIWDRVLSRIGGIQSATTVRYLYDAGYEWEGVLAVLLIVLDLLCLFSFPLMRFLNLFFMFSTLVKFFFVFCNTVAILPFVFYNINKIRTALSCINVLTHSQELSKIIITNVHIIATFRNLCLPKWLKIKILKYILRESQPNFVLTMAYFASCYSLRLNQRQEKLINACVLSDLMYSVFVLKKRSDQVENIFSNDDLSGVRIFATKYNSMSETTYLYLKDMYIVFLQTYCTEQDYAEFLMKS